MDGRGNRGNMSWKSVETGDMEQSWEEVVRGILGEEGEGESWLRELERKRKEMEEADNNNSEEKREGSERVRGREREGVCR